MTGRKSIDNPRRPQPRVAGCCHPMECAVVAALSNLQTTCRGAGGPFGKLRAGPVIDSARDRKRGNSPALHSPADPRICLGARGSLESRACSPLCMGGAAASRFWLSRACSPVGRHAQQRCPARPPIRDPSPGAAVRSLRCWKAAMACCESGHSPRGFLSGHATVAFRNSRAPRGCPMTGCGASEKIMKERPGWAPEAAELARPGRGGL